MRRNVAFVSSLAGFLLFLNSPIAFAQSLIVGQFSGGLFDQSRVFNFRFEKNIVGDFTDQTNTSSEYRALYVYDFRNLTTPIASATLTLHDCQSFSDDPSENYELHDVVTPINTLLLGNAGIAGFNDLGEGVVYGTQTITTYGFNDVFSPTDINIPLNSFAIDAINKSGGFFAIGGSVSNLSHFPRNEFIQFYGPTLQITLVPEPTSAVLVALAMLGLCGRYRSA